jgi:hypothetical protein
MATRSKAKSKSPRKSARKVTKAVKAKADGKQRRQDGLVAGSAGAQLVDAICRKDGATHAELKALVGWKSCLPFALKSVAQAKVRLRKERDGREVRYFGTATA